MLRLSGASVAVAHTVDPAAPPRSGPPSPVQFTRRAPFRVGSAPGSAPPPSTRAVRTRVTLRRSAARRGDVDGRSGMSFGDGSVRLGVTRISAGAGEASLGEREEVEHLGGEIAGGPPVDRLAGDPGVAVASRNNSTQALSAVVAAVLLDGPSCRYAVSPSAYPSCLVRSTTLIGRTTVGVRPRRVRTVWISARPTRPLPSANGWIVSNWAWVSAAWISGACRPLSI